MSHLTRLFMLALLPLMTVTWAAACSHRETNGLAVLPPLDFFPAGYMAENDAVTLTFEPSDEKRTETVYRVAPHVDRAYVEDMARKLGVQGTIRHSHSGKSSKYEMQDADTTVALMGGCLTYESKTEGAGGASDMSEAEAKELARSFLAEHGLLPADAEISETLRSSDGYLSVTFTNRSVPILFAYFPYAPPPFTIYLALDHQRSVRYLAYCWPELERMGEYPVLSEREAHQDMLSTPTESAPDASVMITSFARSYYTSTDKEGTSYIVPVYCAMGERHRDPGEGETGCVAALPAIPASLMRRGYPDWGPR